MSGIDEPSYLDDLKSFRWALYHHRKSREIIKCLSRYYYKKYKFEHFAEEIIIAGYDLQNVSSLKLIDTFCPLNCVLTRKQHFCLAQF